MGGQEIEMITDTKQFRVLMESQLNWNKQSDAIKAKADRDLGQEISCICRTQRKV